MTASMQIVGKAHFWFRQKIKRKGQCLHHLEAAITSFLLPRHRAVFSKQVGVLGVRGLDQQGSQLWGLQYLPMTGPQTGLRPSGSSPEAFLNIRTPSPEEATPTRGGLERHYMSRWRILGRWSSVKVRSRFLSLPSAFWPRGLGSAMPGALSIEDPRELLLCAGAAAKSIKTPPSVCHRAQGTGREEDSPARCPSCNTPTPHTSPIA